MPPAHDRVDRLGARVKRRVLRVPRRRPPSCCQSRIGAQRSAALIFSSAAEPGQRSLASSVLSGASTVFRWACRSSDCVIDVEQSGDHLALGGVLLQERHGGKPVVHVVIGVDLAQRKPRAVVLLDHLHGAGRLVDVIGARPVMTSSRFTLSLCSRT